MIPLAIPLKNDAEVYSLENLILSLNVVLPLFLMMALGYFLTRIKLFDSKVLKVMNNLIFKVFLPILLFMNIYNTDLGSSFHPRLMAFSVISLLVIYIFVFLFILIVEKENAKRGVLIQGIFRSNFIIFGIPITAALLGESNVGGTAMMIAVVIPLYNALSVVALSVFNGTQIRVKKIVRDIITNPLIIASVVSVVVLVSGLRLPEVIENTARDLGSIATPLALVVLGGSFEFRALRGYGKQLTIGLLGRLVVIPLIFLPIAVWLGFRGSEMVTLMAMFCAPTAVSSFTMAQQMGGDDTLAGALVVFGSLFSVLTIFLWTFLLVQMGFIY